jgi:hypothetical protein
MVSYSMTRGEEPPTLRTGGVPILAGLAPDPMDPEREEVRKRVEMRAAYLRKMAVFLASRRSEDFLFWPPSGS